LWDTYGFIRMKESLCLSVLELGGMRWCRCLRLFLLFLVLGPGALGLVGLVLLRGHSCCLVSLS
jgi:hypothetical protein